VKAVLQREGIVMHLIVKELEDLSAYLDELATGRYDQPHGEEAGEGEEALKPVAPSQGRHPRNIAKQLFPSRDFH